MRRLALTVLAVAQAVLALRLIERLLRTSRGTTVQPASPADSGQVSVIVPVLNEADRLMPCLHGLVGLGPEVSRIVVVDGGSTDPTVEIIRQFQQRDDRIELVETTPPPFENGKAHGLLVGMRHVDAPWVLTIDADVRPEPGLVSAMLETARRQQVKLLSVATSQRLADRLDQVAHPAMLTTLIYRFGIPGHATANPARVQANGQCQLISRDLLERVGGFGPYRHVIAEDVALARDAARIGERVGFFEAPGLVTVEMYRGGFETLRNWSRSLPLTDARNGGNGRDLATLALLQAAPLPLLLLSREPRSFAFKVNTGLIAIRLGVLAGSRRAYRNPNHWYWLSPLADAPVVLVLIINARRRRHRWRGRIVHQGGA